MEDTIAAISTAVGPAGIAIVRISGPRALAVADTIFVSRAGQPSRLPSHTIHLGTISHNGDAIDRVLLSVMHAPRTYTGEPTVEINCHGGSLTVRQVLAACLANGARLAEPGEFTKRAFLNGKVDLTQAEAVMDLISAKSARAKSVAARVLEGHLSRQVNQMRETLVEVLAHLEAYIDFPEEDIVPDTLTELRIRLIEVVARMNRLIGTAEEGRILREGVRVTIVGRPNAGKSSLLNALLGEDRAIVTSVPGTTRDTIEETASLDGLPVVLTDTAGIRTARGTVERHGLARTEKSAREADIVLHVIDASRRYSTVDKQIRRQYQGAGYLLVLNKMDLAAQLVLPDHFEKTTRISVSAKSGAGLTELRKTISEMALQTNGLDHLDTVINDRHLSCLVKSKQGLTKAITDINNRIGADIIAQEIHFSIGKLDEIVGRSFQEDVISKIFSTFCIGK